MWEKIKYSKYFAMRIWVAKLSSYFDPSNYSLIVFTSYLHRYIVRLTGFVQLGQHRIRIQFASGR